MLILFYNIFIFLSKLLMGKPFEKRIFFKSIFGNLYNNERFFNRAEKGRNDIHVELNNVRGCVDGISREKVENNEMENEFD